MRAAADVPARRAGRKLLVVDPIAGRFAERRLAELPQLLARGDLLVLNDAATLPASLHTADGALELRLCGRLADGSFVAVSFGAGDWRMRTEDRPPPPQLREGQALRFRGPLRARVLSVRQRWVTLRFTLEESGLWPALYAAGRPIQYSYLRGPLALWDVQTVYAGRPWAFEPPSAGIGLTWEHLLGLRARGVALAPITHAAGLSSTGDPILDAQLPLEERTEVPAETERALEATRARGGRIIALGTTAVRALESPRGATRTTLRLGPKSSPRVAHGVLTGMHAPAESHFELLLAFAPERLLAEATAYAAERGFVSHEFGDCTLVLPGALGGKKGTGYFSQEPAGGVEQGRGREK